MLGPKKIIVDGSISIGGAEASAVQAHVKQGPPLAPGMEIGYVIRDARKWKVDPEIAASKFDTAYYRGLLEKAWGEAAFVFGLNINREDS